MRSQLVAFGLMVLNALAIGVSSAAAKCLEAPPPAEGYAEDDDTESGPTRKGLAGRVVAPIMVNGQGPFRFLVDTGANRSVLSPELAAELALQPHGEITVHALRAPLNAKVAKVDSLAFGRLPLPGDEMPIMGGEFLGGEAGVFGVDGMVGRRLRVDLDRKCIEIAPSRYARSLLGWRSTQGELRFGQLVHLPGTVGDLKVRIIFDTGADYTFANLAFRDAIVARGGEAKTPEERQEIFSAGEPAVLDQVVLVPSIRIGDAFEVTNTAAFVGDFHIFQVWGFTDEPALLIGMNVLGQTRGFAIDYARGTVHFKLRPDPAPRRTRAGLEN